MTAWHEDEGLTLSDGDPPLHERRQAREGMRWQTIIGGWVVILLVLALALVLLTAGVHYLVRALLWAWGWSG